jgi:hypothetical protein
MSAAARTAWPFIQRAVREGLESEQVIEALREAGVPTFRRADMLALIREASGAELLKSDIARWPKEFTLPFNRVRESVTKIVAPFSYTLKLTVVDSEGETREILRQAHSTVLRTADQVLNAFLRAAALSPSYEDLEVESAEVVDVVRAGPEGTI